MAERATGRRDSIFGPRIRPISSGSMWIASGGGRFPRHFPVGESGQPLGEPDIPEVVPPADLRGAPVEDGGDLPGVHGDPPPHLVVRVAEVEEEARREDRQEGPADQSVRPAAAMKGRSIAIVSANFAKVSDC